jgi:hypothetical protein
MNAGRATGSLRDRHDRHWPATPGSHAHCRPSTSSSMPSSVSSSTANRAVMGGVAHWRTFRRFQARPVFLDRPRAAYGDRLVSGIQGRASFTTSTGDDIDDLRLSADCPQDVRRRPTATNAAKRCTSKSDRPQGPSPLVRDPHGQNLTGQLVRPTLPHLRNGWTQRGLNRRSALAISREFSVLPDVRRPQRRPKRRSCLMFPRGCELGGDLLTARAFLAGPGQSPGWWVARAGVGLACPQGNSGLSINR